MKTLSNIHLFECEKRILKVINIREEQFDKWLSYSILFWLYTCANGHPIRKHNYISYHSHTACMKICYVIITWKPFKLIIQECTFDCVLDGLFTFWIPLRKVSMVNLTIEFNMCQISNGFICLLVLTVQQWIIMISFVRLLFTIFLIVHLYQISIRNTSFASERISEMTIFCYISKRVSSTSLIILLRFIWYKHCRE
jgi:hypothetical protein